ncbi:ABC transporter substrate-binding protein [Rhodopila sp.]|uniref:ABC transporter substrate-binding protein n=1 Tax=Rhodopila sp. TaxID=2480087 RepID=UPI003D10C2AC
MKRNILARALVAVLGLFAMGATGARAGGTLIVGMTAGDLPVTTGNPDQGFEGYRFVGYNLYDSLVLWDLSKSDKASDIKPGLATAWHIDPNDHKRWIFTLRQGVKWQDGCPFTADDVLWNLGYSDDPKAPQFNPAQFAQARSYLGNFAGVSKIDDHTVAFETTVPDSLFPYEISYVMMISPCRAKEAKYNWGEYAKHPSGTGPYRFAREVPHQRMEMVPNKDYWDQARVPKQDKLVLIPMPEASTRTAALLSGQVNWIEAPSPDAIARLKSAGMQIITNTYPHNWTYQLNFVKGPFTDLRVRQAANYALNRGDMKELLNGLMLEGFSTVPPSTPYYGHPKLYKYDPAKAKALLKEAGCVPCKVTFAISTSGSGQMQPLPMNELVKSQMEAVGFQVTLQTMDWNALLDITRAGVDKYPDISGINVSRQTQDPFNALIRHVWSKQWAPKGSNWGHYKDAATDKLCDEIFAEFDDTKRLALLTQLNEKMNANAVLIFVAHDLNPRALSPKVHGFVQAQSWFQDLTPVSVSP